MATDTTPEMRPIVTRKQAKGLTVKRYFTGKPCPAGHIDERMVSNGRCLVCLQAERTAWKVANPERTKAARASYYAANRKKEIAQCVTWQTTNRERNRANRAQYRAENRENLSKKFGVWQRANPTKFRTYNAKRRALKLRSPECHTADDINNLFSLQRGKCAHLWCRKAIRAGYHVDHIMPLALGGSNGKRNLQLLCQRCNQTKHASHPIDFAQRHGMLL